MTSGLYYSIPYDETYNLIIQNLNIIKNQGFAYANSEKNLDEVVSKLRYDNLKYLHDTKMVSTLDDLRIRATSLVQKIEGKTIDPKFKISVEEVNLGSSAAKNLLKKITNCVNLVLSGDYRYDHVCYDSSSDSDWEVKPLHKLSYHSYSSDSDSD